MAELLKANREYVTYESFFSINRGKVTMTDGTVLIRKGLSSSFQFKRDISGYHFDQVFTDIDKSSLPADIQDILNHEMAFTEVPEEFQWVLLEEDYNES